jgi:hypothetical protein
MTLQQNPVRPITLLFEYDKQDQQGKAAFNERKFEVGFYNYFTEMITIFRRLVARNILVASLKVKVTA